MQDLFLHYCISQLTHLSQFFQLNTYVNMYLVVLFMDSWIQVQVSMEEEDITLMHRITKEGERLVMTTKCQQCYLLFRNG